MKTQLLNLAFEIEIEEGEQFNLPDSIVQGIGKAILLPMKERKDSYLSRVILEKTECRHQLSFFAQAHV
ncbi:MAG: hypothetical protein RLZZ490_1508 [Cyanobacteriota bacterium]